MKNFLVPIYIAIFLLSATAFWYFGHHRPTQQILNAEPKYVYISVPIIPKIETEESNAHLSSDTPSHKTEDFQTQTTTPLTITQKTSTDQTDTTNNAPNNETIVESQTAMEINDDTHHEHHSHSKEDIEAERARRKAFRESAEYLERAEVEKLQMASEMADFFNTLSIEEQRAHFKMCEEIVYSDIPRLFPGEDTPEDLDRLWNSVLSSLISIGYTPPEGVNLR